jgi:hypothetical protein
MVPISFYIELTRIGWDVDDPSISWDVQFGSDFSGISTGWFLDYPNLSGSGNMEPESIRRNGGT